MECFASWKPSTVKRSRTAGYTQAMCGRYARWSDKQRIAELFTVHGPPLPDFGPSWNGRSSILCPMAMTESEVWRRQFCANTGHPIRGINWVSKVTEAMRQVFLYVSDNAV
jgi:hypothetical protein